MEVPVPQNYAVLALRSFRVVSEKRARFCVTSQHASFHAALLATTEVLRVPARYLARDEKSCFDFSSDAMMR